MKWYILNNFTDFISRLKESGVVVKKQRVSQPLSVVGICFPEDGLAKVKEITGIEVVGEIPTDVSNVFLLQIREIPSEFEVKIERHESTESARPLLEEYARKFSKKIFLHGTHGGSHSPVDDDWIHIFPYAAPAVDDSKELDRVFGISIPGDGTSDIVIPNRPAKIPLKDPNGVHYGEIEGNGNNLYIYFDITHSWSERHEKVFRKILDQYFSFVSTGDFKTWLEEMKKKQAKEEKKRDTEARKKYIEFVTNRKSTVISDLKKAISIAEKKIGELSNQITETCFGYDQLKENLALIQDKENFAEELGQEYDRLCQHPAVEKVWAYEDKVEVFTKTIVLEGYLIGKFRVSMHLDGRYSCTNLTQTVHGHHHPHVHEPRDVCFGMAKDEVKKLVRKFQFEVAFHKIWGRLNRYDSRNPFISIDKWPSA